MSEIFDLVVVTLIIFLFYVADNELDELKERLRKLEDK